jgi:antitoxin FitA
MAGLTIRRLDERIKARLRLRVARHGRSMEAGARTLLQDALQEDPTGA